MGLSQGPTFICFVTLTISFNFSKSQKYFPIYLTQLFNNQRTKEQRRDRYEIIIYSKDTTSTITLLFNVVKLLFFKCYTIGTLYLTYEIFLY